jgi:hypothetical protein
MGVRETYEQWCFGSYPDEEVAEFTGLTPRALRALARLGAIETSSLERGAGHRRQWRPSAILKATIAGALHRTGLSLPMAGRLAFHVWTYIPASIAEVIPSRVWPYPEIPKARDHPIRALIDPANTMLRHEWHDIRVHLVNGSFFFIQPGLLRPVKDYVSKFVCLGRITADGSSFKVWQPLPKVLPIKGRDLSSDPEERRQQRQRALEAWKRDIPAEYGTLINPKLLAYEEDPDADPELARRVCENYESILSVNISLPMRRAVRKALGLPVDNPERT